jgi:hypothetical protein
VLVHAKFFFQVSQIFVGKARSLPIGCGNGGNPLGQAPDLKTIFRGISKTEANTVAYFVEPLPTKKKSFMA